MEKKNYGVNSIENSLNKVLQPIFNNCKKEFIMINNIIKNWKNIIGDKYSKMCIPKSISYSKDRKNVKLIIIAYNSSIAFYLNNNSQEIIEKIACLYGFKTINQIIIKQFPDQIKQNLINTVIFDNKQEQIFKNTRSQFSNQDLANTIEELGRDIFKPQIKQN